jgi:hypothetical protein
MWQSHESAVLSNPALAFLFFSHDMGLSSMTGDTELLPSHWQNQNAGIILEYLIPSEADQITP